MAGIGQFYPLYFGFILFRRLPAIFLGMKNVPARQRAAEAIRKIIRAANQLTRAEREIRRLSGDGEIAANPNAGAAKAQHAAGGVP